MTVQNKPKREYKIKEKIVDKTLSAGNMESLSSRN